MKINQLIEQPEGTYKIEGELSEAESRLVIEVGITQLFAMGAFSMIKPNKEVH